MKKYGIPYMGSKGGIIPSIAMLFPKADHFYDLFGGGFSVTHYMLENKRKNYSHFHYNEIKSDIVELVKKAIGGEYNYNRFKPEWISKEEFFKRKDHDPYVRICWSFGNNQKAYMFSKEIEPYKKSMHMAVLFNEFDDLSKEVFGFDSWPTNVKSIYQKRIYLRHKIEWYRVKNKLPKALYQFLSSKNLERLQQLQQLQRLQQLQQLERLQQLEQLEQLELTSLDYRKVDIKQNSVVYCDIPYKGTSDYQNDFDHKEFFDWASTRKFPVFISEYNIADSRFNLVYEINKISLLAPDKSKCVYKKEKIYWNGV